MAYSNVEKNQIDAFTHYHIIQEEDGRDSLTHGIGPALPALGHALAGAIATAGAKAVVYPIELCVTRLQVQRQLRGKGETESAARDAEKEYVSLLDAARKIYHTEGGLSAFYTGCAPDVVKGVIDSFLFFLAYTYVRQYEQKRAGSQRLSIGKELGVGIAAGSFAKFFTTPLQNIITRQQTAALVAARDPESFSSPGEVDKMSISDVAQQIRSERGIAGFWRGYSESVVLTLNPAITFAAENVLRRLLPRARRENPPPQLTFLIAALSKVVATTITYPAMLAKSRAQAVTPKDSTAEDESATPGGEPDLLEKSEMLNATPRRQKAKNQAEKVWWVFRAQYAILVSLRKIYQTEGLSGLYSGLEGELLKGFVQHGLTMMMKERAHVGVIQAYYLLLKATRRWPAEFDVERVKEQAEKVATEAKERIVEAGQNVPGDVSKVAAEAQQRIVQAGETVAEGAKKIVGSD